MLPKAPHHLSNLLLLLTSLGVAACDADENVDVDALVSADVLFTANALATADAPAPSDDGEPVQRQPDLVLELGGGATLGFLLDDDGIGMVEQIPASAHVASVLEDPWLADASPAVVWYALTRDGTEIPEPLRTHHEQLAAVGELAPLSEALAGQIRGLAPVPLADETSPCLNATFSANHCTDPTYDHDLCFFNSSGDLAWNVYAADRYKAGFCLQTGTARSWLYYWPGAAPFEGECVYFRTANYVWGQNSHVNGTSHAATTYFTYTWWRAANAYPRAFFHRGIGDPGSAYDWGNMYSHAPCD